MAQPVGPKDSGNGTTQSQLNKACKDVPGFLGAFASDQLPENPQRPFSLIVNYGDSASGGVHWVAMECPAYGDALYFDSYGKGPDDFDGLLEMRTRFREYLVKHSATRGYQYNRWDLQCYEDRANKFRFADVCGEYCVVFVRTGALPKKQNNGNAWDDVIRTRGQPQSCQQRDDAVFRVAGVRKASWRL